MKSFSDTRPDAFAAVGNGNYLYRYGMEEVAAPSMDDEQERMQFTYNEVLILGELTADKVTQAVIIDAFPADYEQKLVNEYNAAKEGLYDDDEESREKIDAYKAFLVKRAELKAMVDEDWEEYMGG